MRRCSLGGAAPAIYHRNGRPWRCVVARELVRSWLSRCAPNLFLFRAVAFQVYATAKRVYCHMLKKDPGFFD